MHKPRHRQAALYAVHRGWQMAKVLAATGCHLEGQKILFCIPDYMDLGKNGTLPSTLSQMGQKGVLERIGGAPCGHIDNGVVPNRKDSRR